MAKRLLGDISISKKSFGALDASLKEFQKKEFKQLSTAQKSDRVCEVLLGLIQREKEPCFLLSAVLEFIGVVEEKKVLDHFRLGTFELWLNQHSGLTFEENYKIRAKIAGKYVERSDYQFLFPIGMGKVYPGTHFVTAHKSPDLDTTVASFWGWLDAFAARVGSGLHVWNVPGGPPASQIEIDWMFKDLFGEVIFTHVAQNRTALNLTGADLLTQEGMVRKGLSDSITSIDHERDQNAVIIVDENGMYLGDWRSIDVEQVRQVILLFSSALRWFENHLHVSLIALFAKESVTLRDVIPILKHHFGMKVGDAEPSLEFSSKQRREVEHFLLKVLHLKKGLNATFEEFGLHVSKLGNLPFEGVEKILASMEKAKLFDGKGRLVEERPRIFTYLEKAVRSLHSGVMMIRARLEKIDIALKTKSEVFGHYPTTVSLRADVEEIRSKMGSYPYLTVNDEEMPVGLVQAETVRKAIMGTVSLRDFCNRDEMTIPSYLEVISVIDHHKSVLQTTTAPFAIISDAQSSNSLVAMQAFLINDRTSLLGQTPKEIEAQLVSLQKETGELATRLTQRLLARRLVARSKGSFYIHPDREFIEYLHFLHAILDDTDLLSKVTAIDVECVTSLLNRMKSISVGKECEVVNLDDLPRDKHFPKKGAQRILQNEEMYSLYKKVYAYREKEVEKNIRDASVGKPSNIFADTKEQNGCCRVGQTKLFVNNLKLFGQKADDLRRAWLEKAMQVNREKPDIDLHIHMMSTIVSADEVYQGTQGKYEHQDEMWIWIPSTDSAAEHLKRFLNSFQASPALKNNTLSVEFLGENKDDLSEIFKESFFSIPQSFSKKKMDIAILRYNASTLNSRKAMVSPFLPTFTT